MEQRVDVSIHWEKWKKAGKPNAGELIIKADSFEKKIQVSVSNHYKDVPQQSIVEKNGMAVLYAKSFVNNKPSGNLKWEAFKRIRTFQNNDAGLAFEQFADCRS